METKNIVFFDFDHTIIDGNSDVVVKSLAGEHGFPEHIEEHSNDPNGWTHYMSLIFNYLHKKGVSQDNYKNCLSNVPLVDGMEELLRTLKARGDEVIILSDSNSFFIESILCHHKIRETVTNIFTNPAEFDSTGCLQIKKFQEKNTCSICPDNLCKGYILDSYLCKVKSQALVFYIGDGGNDFCPAKKLREKDVVFPREGYWLWKKLEKLPSEDLKCVVKPWVNGYDILENIL